MSLANTKTHYGGITKTFHWLTALLILTAIPLGWYANQLPYDTSDQLAQKAFVFSMHKTIGIAAFVVALLRILWALTQPKPYLLNAEKPAEARLAETVHWLLYGSLLLVPLTGWIHHASSSGFAPIWWPFGQDLPFVPKDEALSSLFAGLHIVTKWVLIGAIGFHIAGALKHHVIDRDATLRRMLPGRPDIPPLAPADHAASPFIAALGIWAAAIGLGAATGSYDGHEEGLPQAAALEEVDTDWAVQDGTLSIAVTQLGSTVEGSFADWTAAISFEPRDTPGPAGSVEVTVSIGSLTLGSVTSQALGAEFFAADTFPTATLNGEILRTDTGYVVEGPLTIRDQSVPITMPFTVEIADGVATASGGLAVNRLDFGVGTAYPDESSVGFGVDVTFQLTASRQQ
ncbi:cytochrome b/b6 domain-containing protein [Aestuariivita boseongensis]|uniref:cytochrome b/b6 domain-containing protein n=1 Tax=Aestuariivita boseongensis TaxID=1470562 RepID=UPI000682450C|nr:cytochrome b/b6 domain-containing protein [Aestuariivita boseongensis]